MHSNELVKIYCRSYNRAQEIIMKNIIALLIMFGTSHAAIAQQDILSCTRVKGFGGSCRAHLVIKQDSAGQLSFESRQYERVHGMCNPGPFNYSTSGPLLQVSDKVYRGGSVDIRLLDNGDVELSDSSELFDITFFAVNCTPHFSQAGVSDLILASRDYDSARQQSRERMYAAAKSKCEGKLVQIGSETMEYEAYRFTAESNFSCIKS
jgi:hypothetical protein